MNEIIKCGEFTINDFLKEKKPLEDGIREVLDNHIQEMLAEDNRLLDGEMDGLNELLVRRAQDKYYELDINILTVPLTSKTDNSTPIPLPRFGIYNYDHTHNLGITLTHYDDNFFIAIYRAKGESKTEISKDIFYNYAQIYIKDMNMKIVNREIWFGNFKAKTCLVSNNVKKGDKYYQIKNLELITEEKIHLLVDDKKFIDNEKKYFEKIFLIDEIAANEWTNNSRLHTNPCILGNIDNRYFLLKHYPEGYMKDVKDALYNI